MLGLTIGDRPGRHFAAIVSGLGAYVVDAGRSSDGS